MLDSRADNASVVVHAAENRLEEDRAARWARLYRAHAPRMGRVAFLLTGDARLAEDLVQEAFTRALARVAHLRSPVAFEAYLRCTVVNLTRKHWRRTARERAYLREHGAGRTEFVGMPDLAEQERLWTALQRLGHRQRAALVLRFYEDLSERDTAAALGCPVGTVKSLVHRALTAMRDEIGGEAP